MDKPSVITQVAINDAAMEWISQSITEPFLKLQVSAAMLDIALNITQPDWQARVGVHHQTNRKLVDGSMADVFIIDFLFSRARHDQPIDLEAVASYRHHQFLLRTDATWVPREYLPVPPP